MMKSLEILKENNHIDCSNALLELISSDINNSDAERSINFYDLGIPGYTGIRKTQIQNRLDEADTGKFIYWGIPTPQFNLWKILNRVSGRTKRLKNNVKVEKDKNILKHIKNTLKNKELLLIKIKEKN